MRWCPDNGLLPIPATRHASGGPLSCSGKKAGKEPAREGEDSESLPPPWTFPSFKRPKRSALLDIPAKTKTICVWRNCVQTITITDWQILSRSNINRSASPQEKPTCFFVAGYIIGQARGRGSAVCSLPLRLRSGQGRMTRGKLSATAHLGSAMGPANLWRRHSAKQNGFIL